MSRIRSRRKVLSCVASVSSLAAIGGIAATETSEDSPRNDQMEIIKNWYRKHGNSINTSIERPLSMNNGEITAVLEFSDGVEKPITYKIYDNNIKSVELSGKEFNMKLSNAEKEGVEKRLKRGFMMNDQKFAKCLESTEFGGK